MSFKNAELKQQMMTKKGINDVFCKRYHAHEITWGKRSKPVFCLISADNQKCHKIVTIIMRNLLRPDQ